MSIELTPEDNLRLNVLLANPIQALRIDESKMTVYALSEQGIAKIQLHPTSRDEYYLRKIREMIAERILSTPGGYPTYLRRWNQMGQAKEDNLERLLMLGEPAAALAVVNAANLNPELAKRAWWCLPEAATARSLLRQSSIVHNELGRELAHYLIDYLPFEEEPAAIIESVRLVLQGQLLNEETRLQLWHKGRTKATYLVGFLATLPENLPFPSLPRADFPLIYQQLNFLAEQNNRLAQLLIKLTSASGQTFVETCEKVLNKPANQDVVNRLFEIMAHYFAPCRPPTYHNQMNIISLLEQATHICPTCLDAYSVEKRQILITMPQLHTTLQAAAVLSGLNYSIVQPVFSQSSAIGSLMRKKLAPTLTPILAQCTLLRQATSPQSDQFTCP